MPSSSSKQVDKSFKQVDKRFATKISFYLCVSPILLNGIYLTDIYAKPYNIN